MSEQKMITHFLKLLTDQVLKLALAVWEQGSLTGREGGWRAVPHDMPRNP